MAIEICVSVDELERALAKLKEYTEAGFTHSLAVMEVSQAGEMLDDCRLRFRDVVARASDGPQFNYGRFQILPGIHRFVNGKVERTEPRR